MDATKNLRKKTGMAWKKFMRTAKGKAENSVTGNPENFTEKLIFSMFRFRPSLNLPPFLISISFAEKSHTMGRIFEKRKHKMFARWSKMAKGFTKMGKEIAIAVKQGGPNAENNPRLRMVMQNAKAINMPKERIDNAIKRASEKSSASFEEIVYEGYGPHGVAILVECATDNPTRTVANVRRYFSRGNGNLGTSGSLSFIFERKAVFRIAADGRDAEELALELIDSGCEEVEKDENELVLYAGFTDFGGLQKALEEKGIAVISAEKQRIPLSFVEVNEQQEAEINKILEEMEEDDDVQTVYSNMK